MSSSPSSNDLAIDMVDVSRIYKLRRTKKGNPKTLQALESVSLQVNKGELFGVLGPNGAGKSTLIKILMTLLSPTSGVARVLGHDVVKEIKSLRPRINMVSGGETSGYGLLTVRENLWMFGQFYGLDGKEINARIDVLLEHFKLADRKNTRSGDLSTGLRQKMNIIRGFLTDPEVLFLDEPTLGLDVNAGRDIRDFIRTWMSESDQRTLLLTTHYMQEADELCDRIAIVNKGKILACDTPFALKRRVAEYPRFDLRLEGANAKGAAGDQMIDALRSRPGVRSCVHREIPRGERLAGDEERLSLRLELDEESALPAFLGQLAVHKVKLVSVQNREPTLEDVFIALTGKSIEEAESDKDGEHET